MWDVEHTRVGDSFDVAYTSPSQCAAELQRGSADIGIIPSAAYTTIHGLSILPGVAIASRRAVRSILLVSRNSIDGIRTVALDDSSLTSAALIRVLFEKYWGGGRQFNSVPPNLDSMLASHDAALLIGDPALKVDRSQYRTWDLAEEWIHFTGKPFVFAFWAVREEAAKESSLDLAATFLESRDHGLEPANLNQIARVWSAKLGLTEHDVRQYLATNIHYYLDGPCLEGLQLLYRYAHECRVLPRVPELHFADARPALI